VVYTFVNVQLHPKCPNLREWRLKLSLRDRRMVENMHRGMARSMLARSLRDPHIVVELDKSNAAGEYNPLVQEPVLLAARWLQAVWMQELMGIEFILVNKVGGWCPYNPRDVNGTVENEDGRWPDPIEGEVITVKRWPNAQHWYLSSNKDRVFMEGKFNTIEEAKRYARMFVEKDAQIRVVETPRSEEG
jgi:hypothetical protein